jgi:hypothetical protein
MLSSLRLLVPVSPVAPGQTGMAPPQTAAARRRSPPGTPGMVCSTASTRCGRASTPRSATLLCGPIGRRAQPGWRRTSHQGQGQDAPGGDDARRSATGRAGRIDQRQQAHQPAQREVQGDPICPPSAEGWTGSSVLSPDPRLCAAAMTTTGKGASSRQVTKPSRINQQTQNATCSSAQVVGCTWSSLASSRISASG